MFRSRNWRSSPPEGSSFSDSRALGEVDLDAVGAVLERSPDVGLGLVDEIGEELLAGVAVDAVGRVQEAERRGGDDRLLDRPRRKALRSLEVDVSVGRVAERPLGQDRAAAACARPQTG